MSGAKVGFFAQASLGCRLFFRKQMPWGADLELYFAMLLFAFVSAGHSGAQEICFGSKKAWRSAKRQAFWA
ncbi:hypothetical protein [Phaeodactylibacter luteus]|uniref:Uncharacterized protein n=1 Tax=Phaeodactylibacter luteus TaxID=1564516 RepID=A0A5C6RHK5_9BACT|nr:hypothetical protein [Phaeodactylibacter luteus]TXB61821.1 hypothetical protein FRY97_17115 [Phaeodactylibacter luteus]